MSSAPLPPPSDEELIAAGAQRGTRPAAWWRRTWVWLPLLCILGGAAYFVLARPEGGKPDGAQQSGGKPGLNAMNRSQPVVAAVAKSRRHQPLPERAGNGRAAQHRHRQDPCRRRTQRGDVPRGPGSQAGRPARADRSTPLPGPTCTSRRHDGSRPGVAEERPGRPRALSHAVRAGFHRQTTTRHAGLPGQPARGCAKDRPGADRQCQAATHLRAHHCADQRAARPAPGRRRQHRPYWRYQRHRSASRNCSRSRWSSRSRKTTSPP